jgi:hypothetical protein
VQSCPAVPRQEHAHYFGPDEPQLHFAEQELGLVQIYRYHTFSV